MKLLLKRHPPLGANLTSEQEEAFPSPDQIDIGELVINTVTGKLYTKLNDGSVVEFISQRICFDPIPGVSFYYQDMPIQEPDYLINNFCCSGGLISVVVDKLKLDPFKYNFYLVELTNNTNPENISIGTPSFTNYSITDENDIVQQYRKATIPITISLNETNYNNISLFQFKMTDSNNKNIRGSDRILTIKCLESE